MSSSPRLTRFPDGNRSSQPGLPTWSTQNKAMMSMLMGRVRCTLSVLVSARAALFAGFREVDRQAAPPQLLLINGANRLVATI